LPHEFPINPAAAAIVHFRIANAHILHFRIANAEEREDGILNKLHEKDLKTPDLGLRAFCWGIEKMI
jgi:hypothetical protein